MVFWKTRLFANPGLWIILIFLSLSMSAPALRQTAPEALALTAAARPSPRDGAVMAYDPVRKVIVLFGGYSGTLKKDLGDTWTWNGKKWTLVSQSGPSPRSDAGMDFDLPRKKMILFGGCASYQKQADTWSWNGVKWSKLNKKGPEERFDHAMAYYPKHKSILLFGGWFASDTWEWLGAKWAKRGLDLDRDRVAMAYDKKRGKMVFFGGFAGGATYGDTWEFDGKAWVKVSETGPPARNSAQMAYDENLKKVVLFGGHNWIGLNLNYYRDTWAWDGIAWNRLKKTGPSARTDHAMATDTARKRIVLFGGSVGEKRLGDTWEWDGRAWKKVDP
jgi:hypothetical protein